MPWLASIIVQIILQDTCDFCFSLCSMAVVDISCSGFLCSEDERLEWKVALERGISCLSRDVSHQVRLDI